MKTNEKTDLALPLLLQISQEHGEDHAVMPGEFAGMYQAGFESGYKRGREAGYRQGFNEGTAAVHQGPDNGAAIKIALEGKPAPKVGPPLDPTTRKARVSGATRRMLLGMPCVRCRVYLLTEETHCPCCKQAGDNSVKTRGHGFSHAETPRS
jgi:hypothetical protein